MFKAIISFYIFTKLFKAVFSKQMMHDIIPDNEKTELI